MPDNKPPLLDEHGQPIITKKPVLKKLATRTKALIATGAAVLALLAGIIANFGQIIEILPKLSMSEKPLPLHVRVKNFQQLPVEIPQFCYFYIYESNRFTFSTGDPPTGRIFLKPAKSTDSDSHADFELKPEEVETYTSEFPKISSYSELFVRGGGTILFVLRPNGKAIYYIQKPFHREALKDAYLNFEIDY